MKKILSLIVIIFIFTVSSFSQKKSLTIQNGYSYSTGLIGAEYQFGKIGIAAGWLPLRTPETHKLISNYSAAVTLYGCDWNKSGWYVSGAFASSAYLTEDLTSPMFISIIGYKQHIWSGLSLKGGAGYAWCKYSNIPVFEVTARWTFGL